MVLTFGEVQLRPDGKRRWFLPDPRIPNIFGTEDVRHQSQRASRGGAGTIESAQHLAVGPIIISKQAAEIVKEFHGFLLGSGLQASGCAQQRSTGRYPATR